MYLRKRVCIHCKEYVENSKHLFECKIVRKIWEYVEKIFHFYIQWKHIIVGFYHEVNTKTSFFNEFISSVAYSIYKYKMTARYEKKMKVNLIYINMLKILLRLNIILVIET